MGEAYCWSCVIHCSVCSDYVYPRRGFVQLSGYVEGRAHAGSEEKGHGVVDKIAGCGVKIG